MKFVLQWKCNLWVNYRDAKDNTIYFDTAEEAKAYACAGKHIRPVECRVAEYRGGRKYVEVERFIAE